MLQARGIQGMRVLQGLLAMAGKHKAEDIEKACELALTHGAFRLRELRALMKRPQRQQQLGFVDQHPLIRPMEHYGRIVRVDFRPNPGNGNGPSAVSSGSNDEFNALGATSGESPKEEPTLDPGQALPAVQPPASALGSLSSGALSSGPAKDNLPTDDESVNFQHRSSE
jgi:hypothetical protein